MKSVLGFLMAKSQQSLSEHQIARRIKDGRGQGFGKKYQPWLYVQDVPSEGRSHRIYSHKTCRVHHLLSDLELTAFLVFEWSPDISDIREQFPLRREISSILYEDEYSISLKLEIYEAVQRAEENRQR